MLFVLGVIVHRGFVQGWSTPKLFENQVISLTQSLAFQMFVKNTAISRNRLTSCCQRTVEKTSKLVLFRTVYQIDVRLLA